jgi:hypothetical protein
LGLKGLVVVVVVAIDVLNYGNANH